MRAATSSSQFVETSNFIGTSPEAKHVNRAIDKFARVDDNVLLIGNAGTGKKVCARNIHLRSRRRKSSFVILNCSALGITIDRKAFLGSEDVGTGSKNITRGILDKAHEGTLYLENLTEIPPKYQSEKLRIIEEKKFRRVGGQKNIMLNVRFMSSCKPDMEAEIREGRFRKGLYYLLSELWIPLPRLTKRKQDIPELLLYFLKRYCKLHNLEIPAIPAEIFVAVMEYEWEGNTRELQDCIHNLVKMSPPGKLSTKYLPFETRRHPLDFIEVMNMNRVISEVETYLIKKALGKYGGSQVKAARLLGIPVVTLHYRIKKHSIPILKSNEFHICWDNITVLFEPG